MGLWKGPLFFLYFCSNINFLSYYNSFLQYYSLKTSVMANSPVTPYVLPQCGACPEIYLVHRFSALLFTMEPLRRACFPDNASNKNARYTKIEEKRERLINNFPGLMFQRFIVPSSTGTVSHGSARWFSNFFSVCNHTIWFAKSCPHKHRSIQNDGIGPRSMTMQLFRKKTCRTTFRAHMCKVGG